MERRQLGKSGIPVSSMGFGGQPIGGNIWMGEWRGYSRADDTESLRTLQRAFDLGVNLIDTSDMYGAGRSETVVGRAIRGRRDQIVVATKGSTIHDYGHMYSDVSYHHLVAACHRSLKRLGTDYIDLYFIHTPNFDAKQEEGIRRALDELRKEGSIRLAGVSIATNMDKGIQLIRGGWVDALMVYYNMYYQLAAHELLPLAAEHGVGILSAVPFSWGVLTGKYTSADQVPDEDVRKARVANAATGGGGSLFPSLEQVEEIKSIVTPSGLSLVAGALQFVLAHPAVSTVIPGARTVEQLEQNVAAVDGPPLPASEHAALVQQFGK